MNKSEWLHVHCAGWWFLLSRMIFWVANPRDVLPPQRFSRIGFLKFGDIAYMKLNTLIYSPWLSVLWQMYTACTKHHSQNMGHSYHPKSSVLSPVFHLLHSSHLCPNSIPTSDVFFISINLPFIESSNL